MTWYWGALIVIAILYAAHAIDIARQARKDVAAIQAVLVESLAVINHTFAIEAHNWGELKEMFDTMRADALEIEQRQRAEGE